RTSRETSRSCPRAAAEPARARDGTPSAPGAAGPASPCRCCRGERAARTPPPLRGSRGCCLPPVPVGAQASARASGVGPRVQPAFLVLGQLPPPAARPHVLARRDRARAGGATDGRI